MNLIISLLVALCVILTCTESRAGNASARFLSANNAMHFAWLDDNTVVKGDSRDHFSKRSAPHTTRPGVPYSFGVQAFKKRPMRIKDLVSISSNDSMHFAWYIEPVPKGDPDYFLWVCAGPSNALGTLRDWYRSSLPRGATPDNLLFMRSGVTYDLNRLRGR